MGTYILRRGPNRKTPPLELVSTPESFAVRFRNRIGGSATSKSALRMPFLLGRNLHARSTKCPSGLALFSVEPDKGSKSLPGMGDPVAVLRDSTMNYIRSQVGRAESSVVSCYHTYHRVNQGVRSGSELIPSGALYLEFHNAVSRDRYRELFDHYRLLVDRAIPYWKGAYVVSVTQATGANPLKLARELLELKFTHNGKEHNLFDYAEPLFHRRRSMRVLPRDPVFPYQWHLRNDGLFGGEPGVDIGAPEAWDLTRGHREITIAVIDDAFDLTVRGLEVDRLVSPLNVHDGSGDVMPTPNADEWHGTAVLGLISAAHDGTGVCGIAPECPYIPIKLEPLVDDDAEASAFDHAVKCGAAVINCSWGPYDSYDDKKWPIPRLTELAIENAYRNRVAVVFAAGNGSESVDLDGYASHPAVISVSATTDRDERAQYSDYGQRVWVCAPSSGGSKGIVTTDVRDGGYNPFGDLTSDFGGTSASAPIVSGIIALMQSAFLAENPGDERLDVEEVRAILRAGARKIGNGAPPFRDYWSHKMVDPVPNKEGHSVSFGYGCVDAAECVRIAAGWKRKLKSTKNRLRKLQSNTAVVRREPKISGGRKTGLPRSAKVKFYLPSRHVGDPMAIFGAKREQGFDHEQQSRFNSGEHVWLGTEGLRSACAELSNHHFTEFATISRGEGKNGDRFSYGEIVALSGDFYGTPDELFYEKPTWISLLWEDNDTSDLTGYFKKELKAIKKQMEGTDLSYPDYNMEFWWNAKNYAELAKDNNSHFGWHNMMTYCKYHTWAIDLAVRAGKEEGQKQDDLLRKALYYNGFADHFLTDGFAAGHIRIPRQEIREWAKILELSDTASGFLSKLLHDQDGHRETNHGAGEVRPEEDGLHVMNSLGHDWWTRCDGQLFIESEASSRRLSEPVMAVKKSVLELFTAYDSGKVPEGVFTAIEHVPFPHEDEVLLTEKFDPTEKAKIKKWVKDVGWYEFGVNEENVTLLFKALPDLMEQFRKAVSGTCDFRNRVPKPYVVAFCKIG